MKKIYVLLIVLISAIGYSQTIKGIVKDASGSFIENAYVYNSSSQTHSHTDEFGGFTLDKTSVNDVILISALGFKKIEITVNSSFLEISLQSEALRLEEVTISSKLPVMNVISKIDLETRPVNSSQEILRKVPGLFIGQHAGGGKAEQIFLRGFDIDHGTDIAISVDGMPVNMVSHAHGQGYADLHFVIPETLDKIDFGKGSYFASKGDFATAGYVAFQTKEKLKDSRISFEAGQFNTLKTVGLFNLLDDKSRDDAYIATEYVLTDGPFDSPQNFKRINLFGKYTANLSNKSKVSFTASRFTSKWDASGQIPQRLVDAGVIGRFGAVDDTEGGSTSRTNVNVAYTKAIDENTFFKANSFYSNYEFELFSNFTFFLVDPINGDQIKQREFRNIYGVNTELSKKYNFNSNGAIVQYGFGFRADETQNSELSRTLNRKTNLEQLQLGDVDQTNYFGYVNAEVEFGKLKVNPALRIDYFKFNYEDKLVPLFNTQTESKAKFSPKLNFIYTQNRNLQFFLKSGFGFHSNDTRVVVAQQGREILPTSFGGDIGTIFKATPRLIVNSALWFLNLQQEFVYVGDAGIVEPSGRSRRLGADLGIRYQLTDYLFLDADANYTYARSIDEPNGADHIPLAPDFTTTGGLSFTNYKGFSGGINYRYLKTRPANEDNSIVAEGYFVSDLNLNYETNQFIFGFSIENIFNTEWNETQFATESRLQNETASVEEIHFTPGTPFFLKGKITYKF